MSRFMSVETPLAIAMVLAMKTASMAVIVTYDNEDAWNDYVMSPEVADFEFEGVVNGHYADQGAVFSSVGQPWAVRTTDAFANSGARSMYVSQISTWVSGPWDVSFAEPQLGVSFWTHDLQATDEWPWGDTLVELFAANDSPLGSFWLGASGGGHGPLEWGFNGYISDSVNISRVLVTPPQPWGEPLGGDALQFDNVAWSATVLTLISISNGFWNDAVTWDDGTAIPSAYSHTVVDGHTVTLDQNGQTLSLAIRADGAVVVRGNRSLTIVDDLQLEAGKLALARDAAADVSAAFVMAPAAGLEIELAETSSTGSLSVDGNATLAGDLDFRLSGTHPFQAGTHSLMTYDSHGGTFDTVTDLQAYVTGDGLTYGAHELRLTIDHDLLIGDLDLDGDVDFFDYIATSNNFGEPTGMRFQDGDMDGDGDVDFFDYIAVSNHFGDTLPAVTGAANAANVPEPSTLILLAMGAVGLLIYCRRR